MHLQQKVLSCEFARNQQDKVFTEPEKRKDITTRHEITFIKHYIIC